jgi:hypothetical protein
MQPLYGRTGQVYAWLQQDSGHIISLRGEHLAFLVGNTVYSWRGGQHLVWWEHRHMRDRRGAVVVFARGATNLIIGMPGLGTRRAWDRRCTGKAGTFRRARAARQCRCLVSTDAVLRLMP